ncbi:hypothetical protein [Loigolactobacillus binensis]|uniref:Uncharacterized protein n=1 Tax=Loigolactobacillus binensis TaxID=2559922 RepID=A0ABW3EH20_9LACO|nr:hypothetical protein [Loigolactobacillus binensis]
MMQLNKNELILEIESIKNKLDKNGYSEESKRFKKIIHTFNDATISKIEYIKNLELLITMTNIRYLGDCNIDSYDSPWKWMNTLLQVSTLAIELLRLEKQ